jgi:hypothetical protein
MAILPPPMSGISKLFPSGLMVRSAADSMPFTWISRGLRRGCAAGLARPRGHPDPVVGKALTAGSALEL